MSGYTFPVKFALHSQYDGQLPVIGEVTVLGVGIPVF